MKLDIWLGKVANLVKTSCMFLVLSVSEHIDPHPMIFWCLLHVAYVYMPI